MGCSGSKETLLIQKSSKQQKLELIADCTLEIIYLGPNHKYNYFCWLQYVNQLIVKQYTKNYCQPRKHRLSLAILAQDCHIRKQLHFISINKLLDNLAKKSNTTNEESKKELPQVFENNCQNISQQQKQLAAKSLSLLINKKRKRKNILELLDLQQDQNDSDYGNLKVKKLSFKILVPKSGEEDKPRTKKNVKFKKKRSLGLPIEEHQYNLNRSYRKQNTLVLSYNQILDVKQTDKMEKEQLSDGRQRINQYICIKNIGKGAFGMVKLAQDKDKNFKEVAVKFVNKKKLKKKFLGKGKSIYSLLKREVAVMKKMDHPNVVKLFEVIDDDRDDNLLMVMEYCNQGPLYSQTWKKAQKKKHARLSDQAKIDPEQARRYFRDFLLGLDYIHNFANVVHRDIKPGNLLISHDNKLKLADFGISAMQKTEQEEDKDIWISDSAGTQAFLAPETWGKAKFKGKGADIWAGGVTLYYLIFGKLPFREKNFFDLRQQIQTSKLQFPYQIDQKLEDLLIKSLIKDPEKRITLPEMMSHEWITYNGKKPIWNKQDDFGVIEITENDVQNAISRINILDLSKMFIKLKRSSKRVRKRLVNFVKKA